ncbi:MAG: hydrolase [Sinobacteraceae bacterium]|nr:hydrolase [Nevskiaceae bacterium]
MSPLDTGAERINGTLAQTNFKPHPLLANAHLQTMVPTFFRPMPDVALEKERIELPDGDFVDLGWLDGARQRNKGPILLMVHGLGGGFDSKYALGLGKRLSQRGWRTLILQLRGAGPEPNRRAHCYHHGDTADFHHVCGLLKQRHPDAALYAAGWSLGASIVLKAVGEKGEDSLLGAAAAASAPFVLEPCAEHLRHGVARLYQNYLLRHIRANLPLKHRTVPLPPGADLQAAMQAKDFFAFDDAYTAPINGFKNTRDYYARASCGQFLGTIARPTLVVNALDDPFMARGIIPRESALAPQVHIETCRHGGHVGFITAGPRGGLSYWLDERFAEFFESQRNGSHIASP